MRRNILIDSRYPTTLSDRKCFDKFWRYCRFEHVVDKSAIQAFDIKISGKSQIPAIDIQNSRRDQTAWSCAFE